MQRHSTSAALALLATAITVALPMQRATAGAPPAAPERTVTSTVFTNSTPIVIPGAIATFTPLTSTIVVSGVAAVLADVDLTTFITHSFPNDLDITLTSPAG